MQASTMADAEKRLRDLVKQIAKNRQYVDSEINLTPIVTGGAHYTSKLFVTTLSAPGKEDLLLFSKAATLGEKFRAMTNTSVFETEIMFYTKILPAYVELEEIYRVPIDERLILPEYYGGSTEYMKELVVMEDLSCKGYRCMDRFECFDWEYASKSVSVLARFHALSVAFEKHDPVAYSKLVDPLKFDYPVTQEYLEKGVSTAVNATDEKYKSRVETFLKDDLRKQTIRKFSCPERRLVLCHGDFRPSNILHKYDEHGNLKVALVDYQIIRRWNPVKELMFFLVCGSDEQFRAEHLHQLFDHYYETFSTALRRFHINPIEVYPEKDFRDDVKQMLSYGLTLGMYCLPFITVDVENAPKPEDCIDVETYDLQTGDRFRERFNGLVRTYDNLGIL